MFEDSKILTDQEYRRLLKGWLPPLKGDWRFLVRASRDGFTLKTGSKCDNQGPTLTIVKSGNYIFGGFTELSRKSPSKCSSYRLSICTEGQKALTNFTLVPVQLKPSNSTPLATFQYPSKT